MSIQRRIAQTILNSLSVGVTPRVGLRHIAVGRLKEVAAIKHDFDQIESGGATVRFIIGRYGSGKSFLIQLLRSYALESKFVVADADFSPERRLVGSSGEGLALYRELVRNLSIQTRPDGNAMSTIIEKWISGIQSRVIIEQQITVDSPEFSQSVNTKIVQTLNGMQELVHGFDFAQVINAYYRGYLAGDDLLKNNAIRWLRGEISNKTEAYSTLKVRAIIDDDNYYDYLKLFAHFVCDVGYSGLIVCLDEAAFLYKITNSVSRKNNYEVILTIINDCMQGKASSIGFIFGGTPEFLEDSRRGLFSYEALRSRLSGNRFANAEMQDMSGPVLQLVPLSNEETFVLLQKIHETYNVVSPIQLEVSDTQIKNFMEESLRRIGAREFATPRELIRDFVSLLNLLVQHPQWNWDGVIKNLVPADSLIDPSSISEKELQTEDPLDRFKDF